MYKVLLPYDLYSVGAIVLAAAALCVTACRGLSSNQRVLLILLAATVLRFDAASQWSLNPWDERFHAVVAKHLINDPLMPVLLPEKEGTTTVHDWQTSHIWLHKPPFALWAMALSMSMFGVNELALRLPSLVFGVAGVWLTYRIGRRLMSDTEGLVAAGFHAVNGFMISLASGRRVADHVDAALITIVEAAVWIVVCAESQSLGRSTLVGALTGLAVLTKSMAGLVPLPIFAANLTFASKRRRDHMAAAVGGAFLVASPWAIYTAIKFPMESALELQYTIAHLTKVIEGHSGHWWFYLRDMPRYFGEQQYFTLPVMAGLVVRDWRQHRVIVLWWLVPYLIYSAAATKLPNLVMVAAPAVFLMGAGAQVYLAQATTRRSGWQRMALFACSTIALLMPARYALEPSGPFERRDRTPARVETYRQLDAKFAGQGATVYNVPDPIEAMFYSDALTFRVGFPSNDEITEASRVGRAVVVLRRLEEVSERQFPATVVVVPAF